jgi:hypothetical protein
MRPDTGKPHHQGFASRSVRTGLRTFFASFASKLWDISLRKIDFNPINFPMLGWTSEGTCRRTFLCLNAPFMAFPFDFPLAMLGRYQPRGSPLLCPRLARAYANKTRKTVARDVSECSKMGLLVKEKGKVRIRSEAIAGFSSIAVP